MVKKNGTIAFKTRTQEMIWRCEILGQLSDGYWENTRPHNHYKFWHRLEPVTARDGEPAVITSDSFCEKRGGYNLHALLQYVGDRMVQIGRMATAGGDEAACDAVEYMPAGLEEFIAVKESGDWGHDFIKDYMKAVSVEQAKRYYNTPYFMKDLKKDLTEIKKVMKTVKPW